MSSGKSGSNRKNRQRFTGRKEESQKHTIKHADNVVFEERFEKSRVNNNHDRLQWTAPVQPANPIFSPDCPWCGKQIKDITIAINDKETGSPVHFDCVIARISEIENLDASDGICYIGGGRFGIVRYNNPPDTRDFTIRKVYEWEVKDQIIEWRRPISEYFSLT